MRMRMRRRKIIMTWHTERGVDTIFGGGTCGIIKRIQGRAVNFVGKTVASKCAYLYAPCTFAYLFYYPLFRFKHGNTVVHHIVNRARKSVRFPNKPVEYA